MAVNSTIIEVVRVMGVDGIGVEYPWDANACYLIRDDYPYLEFFTRGRPALPKGDAKLSKLSEVCEDGTQWQQWDLSEELSRQRRLGEVSILLKVPKNCVLRCYVIPVAVLSYRDVITMVEEIDAELGFSAAWDVMATRSDRTWSRPMDGSRSNTPSEFILLIEEEMRAAASIRRDPFTELGPRSRLDAPLAENALVSHWAARRSGQLRDLTEFIARALETMKARSRRRNPDKRQIKIDMEVDRLFLLTQRLGELRGMLTRFFSDIEFATPIYPSPLFQRDHRLRLLLQVFAPSSSEAISEIASAKSHYPPLFLNRLWEIWGIVWIAKELRRQGFSGLCSIEAAEAVKRCSWHLTKGDVIIELDFEPDPVFVNYDLIPPVHERGIPALEWAARHQELDADRPFLGLELKCSPDYTIRITTPTQRALLVGDACLANSHHHGKNAEKTDSKPYTVERYRRTIGWAFEDQVIRCHPMGGFVVFPSPAHVWVDFERLPGASDCMLICPSPQGDPEASRRLEIFLGAIAPELKPLNILGLPINGT